MSKAKTPMNQKAASRILSNTAQRQEGKVFKVLPRHTCSHTEWRYIIGPDQATSSAVIAALIPKIRELYTHLSNHKNPWKSETRSAHLHMLNSFSL